MNWMIYPAARAFIKVCAVLFGAGRSSGSPHPSVHAFFPPLSPDSRTLPAFGHRGGIALHPFPVLPHVLGRQSPAGLPRKQNNKKSEHAGLPARPVRPPHSVCGHARPSQYTEMDRFGRPSSFWRPSLLSFPSLIRRDTKPQAGDYSWPGASQRQAAVCRAPCFFLPSCCVSSCPPQFPPWQRLLHGWPFFCPAAWKSCWRPFPLFWRSACLKRSCP